MLKHLAICAALIAFTSNFASAQQREAMLQKVEVPGAAFDLVVAMPKTPGGVVDLSEFAGRSGHPSGRRRTRARVRKC